MCREHPVHILVQEFQVQNYSNKATPQNVQATHSLTNTDLRHAAACLGGAGVPTVSAKVALPSFELDLI